MLPLDYSRVSDQSIPFPARLEMAIYRHEPFAGPVTVTCAQGAISGQEGETGQCSVGLHF